MTTTSRAAAPAAARAEVPVADPSAHATRAAERAFRLPVLVVLGSVGVLVAVGIFSATQGAAGLPVGGVVRSLLDRLPFVHGLSSLSARQDDILFQIRLPRTVLGMLVGGSLAMSGSAYQGVFRNPLADPYLLGVSAGAGLGAALTLGLGFDIGWGPVAPVPAAAFVGALVAVALSASIARGSGTSPATLLLAGIAMAALFSAAQTYVLSKLSQQRSQEVLSWLFGQLNTSGWDQVVLLLPYSLICGLVLFTHRRHLDVLRVGDDEARSLGLDPARARLIIIVTASLLTAAAVAVSGLIAFVGLVVPHMVRLIVGHSYRIVVPLSALFGAAFLCFVDVGARTLTAPSELPVGVITAFVGAPFFAFILRRGRSTVT